MKHIKNLFFVFTILALLAVPVFATAEPASAQPVYTCLPTCAGNDARFITIAGALLSTVSDSPISLQIIVESTALSVEVGVFDGDTGKSSLDPNDPGPHWDIGTTELRYSLYEDPLGDGNTIAWVAEWTGADMLDNDWSSFTIPVGEGARSLSGNYIYQLLIEPISPTAVYASSFKVRTDGLLLTFRPSTFAVLAPIFSMGDIYNVYPNYAPNPFKNNPDPEWIADSTYDGSYGLYLYVPNVTPYFGIWDGDFDHGSYNFSTADTDDPDTPNDVLPSWAVGTTGVLEGVAVGRAGSTGDPSDDTSFSLYQRSPSVAYTVTDPNGVVYDNNNPSGDKEWEQFLITTDPDPEVLKDYLVDDPLPQGLYHVQVQGMDMNNLNAWRFAYSVVGVCEDTGEPCKDIPGNLYHTYTTCTDFANGETGDLAEVLYGVKKGVISNVAPGVFFYYSQVAAPSSSFTIRGEQSVLNEVGYAFPYLGVHKGQVILWDATCSKSSLASYNPETGDVTVTGATEGQVFYFNVKYTTDSVINTAVSVPYPAAVYNFWTEVNGIMVPLSGGSLVLKDK